MPQQPVSTPVSVKALQLCPHSCLVQPQSLGGGRLNWIQCLGIRCFLPSKTRGYLSQPRILTFFGDRYIASRSFSSSAFSNCTMTLPSASSSTTMASSGFALFTATLAGTAAPMVGGRTRQKVQTRSPFRNVTSATFRFFAVGSGRPARPGPEARAPDFSGVSRARFAPVAVPPAPRPRHPRTSSLQAMKRRSMSWSSGSMCSKPSKSSALWMTRVDFRARRKVLKMHRAWYHMIWMKPSSPPCRPCISTRRPMRMWPFSMNFSPPWSTRSKQSWSLHMARPPPARLA
mmetsp:Transcript_25613/g.72931  ORF Transcript_25613/g.72931 Transcript_25613/m.72931 type:complete len:288 (+) Transcript_25613:157-1020(+)